MGIFSFKSQNVCWKIAEQRKHFLKFLFVEDVSDLKLIFSLTPRAAGLECKALMPTRIALISGGFKLPHPIILFEFH